ncbi:glycosyltransferase [Flaviaesturariibacter amylovorans]|uniref:Glycosyltransferase family 4 protein n=1 Tax=Flaviaesturariibacter amylovorans TaxID=1084520 RepID=A0ABP8GBT3_9BACT
MKGLLIFPIIRDLNKADGIVVKNQGIRDGFIKNGVDIDVIEFYSTGIHLNGKPFYAFPSGKYARIYRYQVTGWKKIRQHVKANSYDFIWYRTPMVFKPIADFIQGLRRDHPRAKIILEYGYYPYVNELSKMKKVLYRLNRGNELRAHRNADFTVTYAGQDFVDNLPNIPINNGIELDSLPVVQVKTDVRQRVNFISVSSLKKWHAYERLVAGMPAYLKSPGAIPVHFNIVGMGAEYDKIKAMVDEFQLGEYVTFHHFKTGAELDAVYNDNHLAIGTLGFHRIGITFSSSLKNREYFGRGLPIVVSTPDEDMPADLPYVLYVPEGEEPVDVGALVQFAQRVHSTTDMSQTIRRYAEDNVSWASKIRMVLDYLKRPAEAGAAARTPAAHS